MAVLGRPEEEAKGLRALRAVRHRTANALQVALGWAQLGEGDRAAEALARIVGEEALLSALGRTGSDREQYAFWQLFADAEEQGRPIALRGDPLSLQRGALAEATGCLAEALRQPRRGTILLTCGPQGIQASWPEEDNDVRR